MFIFRTRMETVLRAILIVAFMLNAVAPSFAYAETSVAQETKLSDTPTETATTTPIGEPTTAPTETAVPAVTETPAPATETPTPEVTATVEADGIPLPDNSTTSSHANQASALVLSANPAFITPSGIFTLNWSIEGLVVDGLILQVVLPVGISLHGDYVGTYDEATHTLSVSMSSSSGEVQLEATDPSSDIAIEAVLLKGTETVSTANLIIPAHEQFVLEKQGGEIITMDGKLKVKFPKDVLPGKTIVDVGLPSRDATPDHSLLSQPFEINAKDDQSNIDLHHFDEEIEIDFNYEDIHIAENKVDSLGLYWYNFDTQEWEALRSSVDIAEKTVRGFTRHFSVFAVGVEQWQSANMPTVDNFQVATFTGAAGFSLPIQVPAGPGGLQPELTLSYNSQVVDQSTTETQASWVGMGWTLETGSIEVNTAGTKSTADDSYFLNFGGVSTRLVKDSNGVWHAADENFWKYTFNSTANTWTITDKMGNQYFF